ncbi:hypothetical protein KJ934_01000 [Patescibacteria group bacterium]|nr:hypothetical protein [Patescibacteria group bacterium]MBU4353087.1 hypothetical protein [Patescibacteria group bacterium]MBU4477415.1 hypothetical protein [Patescibacteria group bacterium]MCG2699422.1 hypothetical protein [Candidatus Parcubacteria bacterium]
MKKKEMKGFCFAFLALAALLLSSCAAAPMAMYAGSAVAGGYHYGSTMTSLGFGGGSNGTQQDGVIVYRDGEYAKGLAKKALKNLGIQVDTSIPVTDAIVGVTNDSVRVQVTIIEKTKKLTEMKISAKKNFVVNDPMVAKSVCDEIKRLAGIRS